ncbi:hypothetical protein DQ04_02611090 [Trypanosoma grayi]|uniref:hypothetical protein n=1 Tax=Trypanosoma grayi TaxID=71804 RepID=UPI0004F4B9CB|nr:hypothetical protein DQ04_02611090 [Trypanosoma grayi]KEG11450.1 hypothetical protein DQ04_02611090 [Trypanosoma grayi]
MQPAAQARDTGVRFGRVSHGFEQITSSARYHCLHWASADTMRSPAICFPMVGERLHVEVTDKMLRTVSERGSTSLFAPKRDYRRFIGLLQLVQNTDGAYTRRSIPMHVSWAFHSQMIVDEEGGCSTPTHAVELLSKKLVMWLFSYYSMSSSRHLRLCDLENAFPLIKAMSLQERRRFVSSAVTRFTDKLLSFYDDRVISLGSAPVSATSLLSPAEFRVVTSLEQTSVAFVFKCQMRHDEVLDALQTIIDSWGKRGVVPPSIGVRRAVAVLLSHAFGTFALLPQCLRGLVRPFVVQHLPLLLETHGVAVATKLVTLLRSSKVQKRSSLVALRKTMEEVTRIEIVAHEPAVPWGAHDAADEVEDEFIFDSVAPLPLQGSGVAWRIARGTCRHIIVPLPDAAAAKNTELEGTAADLLFSMVLFSGARLQLSRPLLSCTDEAELCLSLYVGKGSQSVPDDDVVWKSSRKRRRGRELS